MKKINSILILLPVFISLLLLPAFTLAAPNINGEWDKADWALVDEGENVKTSANNIDAYNNMWYDIENMGLYINNNKLYLGINGDYNLKDGWKYGANSAPYFGHIEPGDIAFDFGDNGSFDLGIDYTVKNDNSVDFTFKWGNIVWEKPVTNSFNTPYQVKSSINSVTYTNVGKFGVVNTPTTTKNDNENKYTIEAVVDLTKVSQDLASLFDNNKDIDVARMHYTMECGNDMLEVKHNYKYSAVPEPETFLLLGFGLIGLGGLGRRRLVREDA